MSQVLCQEWPWIQGGRVNSVPGPQGKRVRAFQWGLTKSLYFHPELKHLTSYSEARWSIYKTDGASFP